MARKALIEERLTYSVIGAFYEVYNTLGYGLREHFYMKALERELRARGHRVVREFRAFVMYKGEVLGFERLDMVVDEKLVVEGKAGRKLPEDSFEQTYGYLKSTNLEVALLLHFGPEARFYRVIYQLADKHLVKSVHPPNPSIRKSLSP